MTIEKQIKKLKAKAKNAYVAYQNVELAGDAGVSLSAYINPKIDMHKQDFNEAMAQLEKIDPTCPQGKRL